MESNFYKNHCHSMICMRKIQFNRTNICCTATMFQTVMGDKELNNEFTTYNF